ncbi:DUF397 domain-containing protein [Thermobifida halotolerans]|uniref:DUF397 domain-containing protein n=1 Tax=Thermobifida halotolerans TaxID=483545 RepID=UPI0008392658|nr:DUF397 domain-containing protein [Thermobifida halotolerans]
MDAIDDTWRTSSYSSSRGGSCVEVADTVMHGAAVRDAQNRHLAQLDFSSPEWTAFTHAVRSGVFDN